MMTDDLRGAREIAQACMRRGVSHRLAFDRSLPDGGCAFVDLPGDACAELRADLLSLGATLEDQPDGTIRTRVPVASQPELELS